jgi:hypothetical protein
VATSRVPKAPSVNPSIIKFYAILLPEVARNADTVATAVVASLPPDAIMAIGGKIQLVSVINLEGNA